MAELHARLHQLPPHNFPNGKGTLFPRTLEELTDIVHTHGFRELAGGLDWLIANEPAPPAVLSILHLDFHPYNLIQENEGSLNVIDWTEAGLGDFHADVAETLMILSCMPAGRTTLFDRLAVGPGRLMLRRKYFRAYRHERPIDDEKLRYYCARAAFRRLCQYQRWLCHGARVTGSKSRLLEHLNPELLQTLRDYFRKRTGITLG
jgi:aminoglycoside phosphotransferase (APT) family kinase protein